MSTKEPLNQPIEHIDVRSFDARPIIASMSRMSFSARDTARASEILEKMVGDPDCTVILTVAGSTSAAGCMQVYAEMVRSNMVDAIVATGASIVDMDFFEALGFKHYRGTPSADDGRLRAASIDRIYDTYIDEEELQACDRAVKEVADGLPPGIYSSRAFIREMGRYLTKHAAKSESLVQAAFENDVPIFCPAFSDSSAGFGLCLHQEERLHQSGRLHQEERLHQSGRLHQEERLHRDGWYGEESSGGYVSIDSVRDFRELTEIKIRAGKSGLFMIGGGVPKNFAQDTVVCAEVLGKNVSMHTYAVQITVADVRDGACSSSTLKEANSWGKVDSGLEQMVYAEATTVLPLIVSAVYHGRVWIQRHRRRWSTIFPQLPR